MDELLKSFLRTNCQSSAQRHRLGECTPHFSYLSQVKWEGKLASEVGIWCIVFTPSSGHSACVWDTCKWRLCSCERRCGQQSGWQERSLYWSKLLLCESVFALANQKLLRIPAYFFTYLPLPCMACDAHCINGGRSVQNKSSENRWRT